MAEASWSLAELDNAYRTARRGKRKRPAVQLFELDLERELISLAAELNERRYQPGEYRRFTIYERKPREICAAPFRDRVVHHALMARLEPLIESTLAPHCYACRSGRGTHRAVLHYQRAAKRYHYALKLDIASYFACIDHRILRQRLTELSMGSDSKWLADKIICASPTASYAPLWPSADLVDQMERQHSFPIGNLTSQHFANLYLNPIDQWLQNDVRVGAWLRYVDDIIVLSDSKPALWQLRDELQERLDELRLCIHPRKCELYQIRDGVEVLGYRVWPHQIRLRRDSGYRYLRRLRRLSERYADGEIDLSHVRSSVAAWLGHTRHANARGLERALLSMVIFKRGVVS